MADDAKLTRDERRLLALLGLPTFGLALSITVVTTYLPVLATDFTSSTTIIGLIIGGEGLFALVLPLVMGAWSDRVQTRIGRRRPFLVASAPVAVAAMVAMPFAPSLVLLAGAALAFFVAYFSYYAPYRALFPDLVRAATHGRAQSAQAVWRGVGLGFALVAGGVLLDLWRALPFLIAAGVLTAVTVIVVLRLDEPDEAVECLPEGVRGTVREIVGLLRSSGGLRAFLAANALWEMALAAIKTFIVLFVVVGLGRSAGFASLLIGGVAAASVLAALAGGWLGDRLGLRRVMLISLWVYGVGLLLPAISQDALIVAPALPLIAFGGAVLMTLPYGLLMGLMPPDAHGASTGLYGFSRGVGVVAGPLVAGVAIDLLRPVFQDTGGYAAIWVVAGGAILASVPLLRRIELPDDADRRSSPRPRGAPRPRPVPAEG